jgi:hypothetical protein
MSQIVLHRVTDDDDHFWRVVKKGAQQSVPVALTDERNPFANSFWAVVPSRHVAS